MQAFILPIRSLMPLRLSLITMPLKLHRLVVCLWILLFYLHVVVIDAFSEPLLPKNTKNTLISITVANIPADLPRIRECRKTAFADKSLLLRSEQSFVNADAAATGRVLCILATEEGAGNVLGTADVRLRKDELYVNNVFVLPTARGFGIGTKLMNGVEDLVANKSQSQLFSLAVETQNTAAVELYRRCGYTTPGIHAAVAAISNVLGVNLLVTMTKQN
jgi:ribosomal protein S18 acetylase RimI-like enzyme